MVVQIGVERVKLFRFICCRGLQLLYIMNKKNKTTHDRITKQSDPQIVVDK